MNNLEKKIRIFFIPFLVILFSIVVGFTFLHWLIIIKLEWFQIDAIYLTFGFPIVLSLFVVFLWIDPRLELLRIKIKERDFSSFYFLIAWFTIAVPTILAQEYIITATGKLSHFDNVSQIINQEKIKYYTLDNFYVDKESIGVASAFDVSGKRNQYFIMSMYITMPIYHKKGLISKKSELVWLGKKYSKSISNRLSKTDKESSYKIFQNATAQKFKQLNPYEFKYLNRISFSEDFEYFTASAKNSVLYNNKEIIILLPETIAFEERNDKTIKWFSGILIMGNLFWVFLISIAPVNEKKLKRFLKGKKIVNEDFDFIKIVFRPTKGYYVTPILLILNFSVFILMFLFGLGFNNFKSDDLIVWGANYSLETLNGQWWRLVSSIFLHNGFFHLFYNMVPLTIVGFFAETILGSKKFLSLYITSGILASISSLWWYENNVSVGASGAVYGLFGFLMAFLFLNYFQKGFSKNVLISFSLFIAFNLIMGYFIPGIDNAAHLGGLFSGVIFGLFVKKEEK